MSDSYHQLLDATIRHLQDLKARGVRFVPVSPKTLTDLNESPPATLTGRTPVPAPSATTRPALKSISVPATIATLKTNPEKKFAEIDLSLGLPGEFVAVSAS